MTEKYDSKEDTIDHITKVQHTINIFLRLLSERAFTHDLSKLESPEKEVFDEFTPKLKNSTYGSEEYKEFLKSMKVGLDHHYKNNRHHPEFHLNGIKSMNLVDIVEMFCDWKAATMRHADGDIVKSIEINQKRFNYSDDLKAIFQNTVELFNSK